MKSYGSGGPDDNSAVPFIGVVGPQEKDDGEDRVVSPKGAILDDVLIEQPSRHRQWPLPVAADGPPLRQASNRATHVAAVVQVVEQPESIFHEGPLIRDAAAVEQLRPVGRIGGDDPEVKPGVELQLRVDDARHLVVQPLLQEDHGRRIIDDEQHRR